MEKRAERLLKRLNDNEAVLITGRANIRYYSGFTSEDAMLFLTKDSRTILTDSRYTAQAKQQAIGFEVYIGSFTNFLKDRSVECIWFEEDSMTVAALQKLESAAPNCLFAPHSRDISEQRRVKDKSEIEKIAAAEALGDDAFSYILGIIKEGMTEIAVAAELEYYMKKNGVSAMSFETICASGKRSAMPHGVASKKVLKHGELLTLDFGCVLDGYCSDMTRTVAIGYIGEREREIYYTVRCAQEAAITAISAGEPCQNIDKIARDIISDKGYGEFFGHGLGHSVGVEIHESPNLSPRSNDTLECGNVVTVEPGIYIEGFCGVRIEDVVAVTESGCDNLTHSNKELIIL